MIIKILLFTAILIIISLFIIFLTEVFIPALKKQTKIDDSMLLLRTEHKFSKLETTEEFKEIQERAIVLCNCNKTFAKNSGLSLSRGQSCAVINSIYRSVNDCKFSCIGLGDCIKSCKQEAISLVNGTAVINNLCIGCGECISSCPKNIIKLVPVSQKEIVKCNNAEQALTSCDSYNKNESVSYPEKKGFKIWESCCKMLKNSF